jgi:ribose transport system permease protein
MSDLTNVELGREALGNKLIRLIKRIGAGEFGLVFILFAVNLVFFILNPAFLSQENLVNTLRSTAVLGIISCGMVVVILTGNIDLSVGSIAAFAGVAAALAVKQGASDILAACVGILVGTAIGFLFGLTSGLFKLPTLLVTLGSQYIVRGGLYQIRDGYPVTDLRASFSLIGNGYLLDVPIPVFIMAIMFIITWVVLSKTVIGRKIYALGTNQEAARYCGITQTSIKTLVLTFSGFCAGIAGVVFSSRLMSGQLNIATDINLQSIAAVVIGGTSLAGGKGGVVGTIIGVIMFGFLRNGLNVVRVSAYWQMVLTGAIIIAVLILNYYREGKTK